MFKISFDLGIKTLCPCCNKAIKPRKWKDEGNQMVEMLEKLSKLIQDKDATTKFEVVKIG